jgi:hypothetical protein
MTSHRCSSSTTVTIAFGVCLVALMACGDRSLSLPHADGGAGGQSSPTGAGTGGEAGGGSLGEAGAAGGRAGAVGGSAGAMTTADGGPCPCPGVTCAAGYVATADPASCCPVCKLLPCDGACVVPSCGPNSHLEKSPDQCCSTCVPNTNDATCMAGRQKYDALRDALIEKYTEGGCRSDDDCALFYEENQCAFDCGMAVDASLVMQATSNLDVEAQADCSTCPLPIPPPCALQTALCSNGKCIAGIPPTR